MVMAAEMKVVRYDGELEEMLLRIVVGIYQQIDTRIEDSIKEFVFKGAWTEGRKYRKRNLTSLGGAIFLCGTDTTERPGVGSAWQLLVPKPRDHHRDGVGVRIGPRHGEIVAEPAAQRTVSSSRSAQDTTVRRR
jgi:hypothetical protein